MTLFNEEVCKLNEQALDYKMQGFAMMGIEKFDKAVELFF